jgi:hypothetical protein
MTRIFILLLGTFAFVGSSAAAEDARRFPQDQISLSDWNAYFAEVKALPGVTIRAEEQQTTIVQEKANTMYAFTTPANPAHPGVVVRRLVSTDNGYGLNRLGYYAGDVSAFARWWHSFDALDEKIKADLNSPAAAHRERERPDVQVRKNTDGTFNLTLTSKAVSNLNDAQMALLPKALEICAGKRPRLGVYKLEKLEKVPDPASTSGKSVALKLDQEIICE